MAHCTGCGLWLRESELFCGICGLKRAVGEPRDRPEPALAEPLAPLPIEARSEAGTGIGVASTHTHGTRLERQDARPGLAPCTRLRRAGRALGASRVCARGNAGRRNGLRRRGTGHLGHRSGDPRSLRVDGESAFMSPWLFALAALLAFVSTVGQTTRQNDTTATRAAQRGASTSTTTVSPAARAKQLGTLGSTGAVSATDEIRTWRERLHAEHP